MNEKADFVSGAFDSGSQADVTEVLFEKLDDAMTPGYQTEFDPAEAEAVGAFVEDALSESDAVESSADIIDTFTVTIPSDGNVED